MLIPVLEREIECLKEQGLGTGVVDASTNTRMGLIEDGLSWFSKKPILGYGLRCLLL